MTPEAFLRDICENPEDDTPRLVYADWLEDNGDPERAEFIRVQIEGHSLPDGSPRRTELFARVSELLKGNESRWRAALPKFAGISWERRVFFRGFVSGVEIQSAKAFREHAAAVFAAAPVQYLELGRRVTARTISEILESPLLARVVSLHLYGVALGDAGAEAVAACPRLAGLHALTLGNASIGPAGVTALAGSTHLTRLDYLHLDGSPMGDEGLSALASSANLEGVATLHVYGCEIGDTGVIALAESSHVKSLRELRLGNNNITDAGVEALAGSPFLNTLRDLTLVSNDITDVGATALASATGLPALAELHLGGNPITSAGALALANGTALGALKHLTFYNYSDQISPEAATALRQRFGDRIEVH